MAKSLRLVYAGIIALFFPAHAQNPATITLLAPAQDSRAPDTRPSNDPFIPHTLDSSIPAPTNFSWYRVGDTQTTVFDVFLSERSDFVINDIVACRLRDTSFQVWNLKINTPYYWKVTAVDGAGNQWSSRISLFTTADAWPRMIYIDGTTNVRDIGGRRTMDGFMIRQGIAYRSAEFNQTYTVTGKGFAQLMALGIACEIDLRNPNENPLAMLPPTVRYFRPITDSGAGILQYQPGLIQTPQLYRDVFRVMADQKNYPLIFHCRIGADRTGTVAALLEALLGCSEQQMGRDYQWTTLSINGTRDTTMVEWTDAMSYLKSFDKEHGTVQAGVWNYLQTIGMKVDELMAIRKIFIDDDRQPFPALAVKRRSGACETGPRPGKRYRLALRASPVIVENGAGKTTMFGVSGKRLKPEWSSRRYNRSPLER